jgi:hypothetical protein
MIDDDDTYDPLVECCDVAANERNFWDRRPFWGDDVVLLSRLIFRPSTVVELHRCT